MSLRPHSCNGVSLVEMLVALAVMGVMAVSISALAVAVHAGNQYAQTRSEAVQHARVACGRIERACQAAYATADYPGFWAINAVVGSHTFPDALVVWKPPGGRPAGADGPPLLNELVVFALDPDEPNRLLEMTIPDDSRAVPPVADTPQWISLLAAMHQSNSVQTVQLTDLLRVGSAGGEERDFRGVVRFETRYHPTAAEWAGYGAGSLDWAELTWPQNLYGGDRGVQQSWCRIELQLVPRGLPRRGENAEAQTMAFFGSAALMHSIAK